jgi:hypothetical protein
VLLAGGCEHRGNGEKGGSDLGLHEGAVEVTQYGEARKAKVGM